MNLVGYAAMSRARRELTVALPFAAYRVRLFSRLLDQLGEPSRFLLMALNQPGVTVADVLAATGLTPEQIERLLVRLQQLDLFQTDDTPTDYGRQLGQALAHGLHGAETTVWLDRLNLIRPVVVLSEEPLLADEALVAGIPRISPIARKGRGEVADQQQRLFQWLGQEHRRLPLQPLIEALWGHAASLPEGCSLANRAWELELPLDQEPGPSVWLPLRLPLTANDGAPGIMPTKTTQRPQLRLPALTWRIDYRAPEGLDWPQPLPTSEHRASCLVTDCEVPLADLEDDELAPAEVDWPLSPVLERIQDSAPEVPAFLARSVVIQRRSRGFALNQQHVLEQLGIQQAGHLYAATL